MRVVKAHFDVCLRIGGHVKPTWLVRVWFELEDGTPLGRKCLDTTFPGGDCLGAKMSANLYAKALARAMHEWHGGMLTETDT